MLRQIVDSYPTGVVLVVGTGIAVALSLVALWAVRSRWPHLSAGVHNDATNGILTVAGTLYAIVLGFVILDAYAGIAEADLAVRAEATQLAQLFDDTGEIDGLGDRAATHIAAYVQHVVTEEWAAMRRGEAPDARDPNLVELFAAFRAYPPRDDAERAFFSEAYARLNDVVESRRARLAAASEEMPDALRGLLIGGGLLIMVLTIALGVESRRIHALLVGGLAALLAFTVLLALALDFPYSGDFRVSDEAFRSGVLGELVAP